MKFIVGEEKSYQRAAIIRHIYLRGRVTKLNMTKYQINLLHERVDPLCPEDLFSLIAEECREKNLLATNRRRSSCRKNAKRNVFKIRVCLWAVEFQIPTPH